jgi:hypothetical protein
MSSTGVYSTLCLSFTISIGILPVLFSTPACRRSTPPTPVISRFTDSFDRPQLGSDWNPTSDVWRIENGHVRVAEARNHPVWLRHRLPRNARIEFDAWSNSPHGDIKCEAYGDGRSYATGVEYTATSYVLIFGGWFNRFDVIARQDEHANDRRIRPSRRVVPGQHYHWVIERRGNRLTWEIDGSPVLEYNDNNPLVGPGHEYFGFNNWATELGFDNLVITAL